MRIAVSLATIAAAMFINGPAQSLPRQPIAVEKSKSAFDGQVIKIGAVKCSKVQKMRSKNSDNPVTVTFRNKSGFFRHVYWRDFNGGEVQYAGLNPGENFTINTFLTHPWVFYDGPGDCKGGYLPERGISRFDIK